MIGYLEGEIKFIKNDGLVLMTGGVGYEILIPETVSVELVVGQEASFHIYTHVKEDQLTLYGFQGLEELDFFKMLLSVSGIGPKVALAIVSSAPTDKLKSSISNGDPSMLSAVSGVGKKTAEKAVIELKGKLGFVGNSSIFESNETGDIYDALMGLGFRREDVAEGIRKLPEEITETDQKIKALLKVLGRTKK
ncbi:Holliday junction branch migration protein RuvA [Patescibacteria group bacterium]|nr:Holliday junction branch migration protein RuvA [Patescibacteria group bacterium]